MYNIEITKENTIGFNNEYEFLLFTLMNLERKIAVYENKYEYRSQIWSTASGWYLTFQVYNKETKEPCKTKDDTQDKGV